MPPTLPPAIPVQAAIQKPAIGDFGDELQVTGKVQEIDPVGLVVTYSEGVAAKFGPTTVLADRLEIHHAEGDKYAIARGNVQVHDPEGELKAHSFVFWYGPKKGPDGQLAVADRVEITLGSVRAKAEIAVIKPDRWEFLNVEGTNCELKNPVFRLKSKRVVILPGKSGTLHKPRLEIFGQDLGNLPDRRFSLDRRSPGIPFPSIGFQAGSGLGVSWNGGTLIGDSSILLGNFRSFPRDYPSYGISYARTFVPADVSSAKIAARSDLTERFSWSYFDNIRVGTLASTQGFTSRIRNSVTVESIWNTGSGARIENEDFSKAIDIAYERSGPMQGLGTNFQLRLQSIRRGSEPFVERGTFAATLQVPPITLANGLRTDVRADLYAIASERNQFGWVRGQAGLVYQPNSWLTLGAAIIQASESGTPDFIADRLVSKRAGHLRADLNFGRTKLSYLAKFDFDRETWYDKEYSISQVLGCIEPFLIRREFPRDYAFGVRFRMDDLFDILERRRQVRTKPVPAQTISKTP
jgi:hypothetical protein